MNWLIRFGGGHCYKEKILIGSDQSGLVPGDGLASGPLKEHDSSTSRRSGVDIWETSTLTSLHISGRRGKRASEIGK